ncbi:MAG: sigma-70 family RNA polymerase sigma factor, partial [Clostridia bacterium]|nr:sigma-70 family RNA polymerase sigma factor [Clostridia bacterium]
EDTVHNTVCRLLSLQPDQLPQKGVFSWLYTVVKNEALMLLRKNKEQLSAEELPFAAVSDGGLDAFIDREQFHALLQGLSGDAAEIVTLKVLGGYTHKEIARMLKKPIGTVQWIYNTSLKKIKATLSTLLLGWLLSFVGLTAHLVAHWETFKAEGGVTITALLHTPTALLILLTLLFALSTTLLYRFSDSIPILRKHTSHQPQGDQTNEKESI